MLGSDRGKLSKAVRLAIAIALAGLIAAGGIGLGLWKQAEYERQAEQHSAEQARHAAYYVRHRCVGLTVLDKVDCATKASAEQRAYQRDEQDLVAQKVTAVWTSIMGGAAVLGMMLSTVGVWLVYTTFKETQRSANVAAENLNVFRKFEDASLSLKFLNCQEVPPGGAEVTFEFDIQNLGRSAAVLHAVGVGDQTHSYGDIIEAGKSFSSRLPIKIAFVGNSLLPSGVIRYSTMARGQVEARLHVHVFRHDGSPHIGGRIMEDGEAPID
jgi:hypothetical protein